MPSGQGGMARSFLVAIPIAARDGCTKAVRNALDSSVMGAKVKRTTCPHQHPPYIGALLLARRHDDSDHIAGLKSLDLFRSFGSGTGETKSIDVAFLPASRTSSKNVQGNDLGDHEPGRGTRAHTRGIQPVRFLQTTRAPIELRQPARAAFNRHSQAREPFIS